jgi:tripartite-type tricarboxylate transporter receptor subunit TctC
MNQRRQFVTSLVGGLLALCLSSPVLSQAFPRKEVRLIVPYPPGGITDILARKLGEKLGDNWGRAVVIDNRPGANGNLAAQLAARAEPDGYTIYMGFLGTHAANISLYASLGYDPVRDFSPISLVANAPMVLTIHPSVPATTVQEFVAYARANPGKLNFGSSGQAGASHLALELFKSIAKVDIVHVPYKGTGPLTIDLLAGRIQGYFDVPITAVTNVESGRVRALVVADTRRSSRLPSVPSAGEVGMPNFLFTTWLGILAPAGIPAAVQTKLNSDIVSVVRSTEFAAWCAEKGLAPLPSTSDEFSRFILAETEKFAKIIRDAKITLE